MWLVLGVPRFERAAVRAADPARAGGAAPDAGRPGGAVRAGRAAEAVRRQAAPVHDPPQHQGARPRPSPLVRPHLRSRRGANRGIRHRAPAACSGGSWRRQRQRSARAQVQPRRRRRSSRPTRPWRRASARPCLQGRARREACVRGAPQHACAGLARHGLVPAGPAAVHVHACVVRRAQVRARRCASASGPPPGPAQLGLCALGPRSRVAWGPAPRARCP